MEEEFILDPGDVPDGGALVVGEEDPIAVFNIGGEYFAIEDTCPHADFSLAEGFLEGSVVECPGHFATFDVTTGRALSPPTPRDAVACSVEVRGGRIHIRRSKSR